MALKLLFYPEPILKRRSAPLGVIDDEVRERVRGMFEILYRERGVGLAAPQVGWSVRLFIANPSGEPNPAEERVYINPRITGADGEIREEEGCLSIPGVRGPVTRSRRVAVRAQGLLGEVFEEECAELKARVIQHELDHLDGILFISRLSASDRMLVAKALRKLETEHDERAGQGR